MTLVTLAPMLCQQGSRDGQDRVLLWALMLQNGGVPHSSGLGFGFFSVFVPRKVFLKWGWDGCFLERLMSPEYNSLGLIWKKG